MASIHLKDVVLDYPVTRTLNSLITSQFSKHTIGGKIRVQENNVTVVRALDHLSVDFEPGDSVGLIGHNGSGKSTLLRVLAGIYEPTQGSVEINGVTNALLGMSLGMNLEATGYENIELNAILHGYNPKEIVEKTKDIEEFSELCEYLSMPIRSYSSGMKVRLSFSMATAFCREILIIDEVMGAGDASFMQKARKRMNSLINNSELVVMANHSPKLLRKFCNKVLWLKHGKKMFFGPTDEALAFYKESLDPTKASLSF